MVSLGFILLTLALIVTIYLGLSKVAELVFTDPLVKKKFPDNSIIRLSGWIIYIAAVSQLGIFSAVSMPPRIPLLLVLPTFLFMAYFFISGRFKHIISATPLQWIILFQSFRIVVELLIFWSYKDGILPKEATFRGNNFDIIFGLTAPAVAWSVRFGNKRANINLLIWNFCGLLSLAIVVFTLISEAYFPALWGRQQSILGDGFGKFPFTFLAGFLMPLAVFLHLFAIVKIRQRMKATLP